MAATLALMSLAILVVSVLGGSLPLATVLTHTRLQLYLSFAAGSMLGAAFCHMLPEAVHLGGPSALGWIAPGLLALFFLERFFAFHHHEAPGEVARPHAGHDHGGGHAAGLVDHEAPVGAGPRAKASSLHWGAAAFGLAMHSLAGGVALASAVAAGRAGTGAAAWGVFLATLLHKPADALTIVSLMLRGGVRRTTTLAVNLGFSLMIPMGCLLFYAGARWLPAESMPALTANTLAFSAGTFLCIALSDLLPELHFHEHDRVKLSVALLAGFGLMAASAVYDETHEGPAPAAHAPRLSRGLERANGRTSGSVYVFAP